MLFPEEDARRIGQWCWSMTTPEVRKELYIIPWFSEDRATIYEYQAKPQLYFVFAHLLYDPLTKMWTLFTRHRAGGMTRYPGLSPTRNLQKILDFLWDADDAIFLERLPQHYPDPLTELQ